MRLTEEERASLLQKLAALKSNDPRKYLSLSAAVRPSDFTDRQRKVLLSMLVEAANTQESAQAVVGTASADDSEAVVTRIIDRADNLEQEFSVNPGLFTSFFKLVRSYAAEANTALGVKFLPYPFNYISGALLAVILREKVSLALLDSNSAEARMFCELKKLPSTVRNSPRMNSIFSGLKYIYAAADLLTSAAENRQDNEALASVLANNTLVEQVFRVQGDNQAAVKGVLVEQASVFHEVLERVREEVAQVSEARAKKELLVKLEKQHANIQAGIDIASIVLSDALGKPSAARHFKKVSTELNGLSRVYGYFKLGEISGLMLVGNVLSVASELYHWFYQEPPSQQNYLQDISDILTELQETVRQGFLVLTQQQAQIIRQLNELLARQTTTWEAVERLRLEFEDARRENLEQDCETHRARLKGCFDQIQAQSDQAAPDMALVRSELVAIKTHAVTSSCLPCFTGGDNVVDLSANIKLRNRLHACFHLLKRLLLKEQMLGTMNIAAAIRIPNPLEWARATDYFLQALALFPVLINEGMTENLVKEVWNTGIDLIQFISNFSALRAILQYVGKYKEQTDVLIRKLVAEIKACRERGQLGRLSTEVGKDELKIACAAELKNFSEIATLLLFAYQLNLLRQTDNAESNAESDFGATAIAWELGLFDGGAVFSMIQNALRNYRGAHFEEKVERLLRAQLRFTVVRILTTSSDLAGNQNLTCLLCPIACLGNVASIKHWEGFVFPENLLQYDEEAERERQHQLEVNADQTSGQGEERYSTKQPAYHKQPKTRAWQSNAQQQGRLVNAVFVGDGQFLTAGLQLSLWDVNVPDPSQPVYVWPSHAPYHYTPMNFLCGDLWLLYPGHSNHNISVLNIKNKECRIIPDTWGNSSYVIFMDQYLIFSTSASGGYSAHPNRVRVWDLQTWQAVGDDSVMDPGGLTTIFYMTLLANQFLLVYGSAGPNNTRTQKLFDIDLSTLPPTFREIKTISGYGLTSRRDTSASAVVDLPNLVAEQRYFAGVSVQHPCDIVVWDLDPANQHPRFILRNPIPGYTSKIKKLTETRLLSYQGREGAEGLITVWDVLTQTATVQLRGHRGVVEDVVILPHQQLASVAEDGMRIWDIATAQCVAHFQHPGVDLKEVVLLQPTIDTLLLCFRRLNHLGNLQLYRFPMVEYVQRRAHERQPSLKSWPVVAGRADCGVPAVLMLENERFVTTGVDLRMWDLNAANMREPVKIWDAPVFRLRDIKRFGRKFFVAEANGSDQLNFVIDVESGAYKTLPGFKCRLDSADVFLDRYLIAPTGAGGNQLTVWDMQAGELVSQNFNTQFVYGLECLRMLSDGYLVGSATPSVDRIGVRIWRVDLSQNPPFALIKSIPSSLISGNFGEEIIDLPDFISGKHCVAWASGTAPCQFGVWDLDPEHMAPLFSFGEAPGVAGIRALDKMHIATWRPHGNVENRITVWNLQTKQKEKELKGPGGDGASILNVVRLSEQYLASVGKDGIKVWDLNTQRLVNTFKNPGVPSQKAHVTLLPDGRLLCGYNYTGPSGSIFLYEFPLVRVEVSSVFLDELSVRAEPEPESVLVSIGGAGIYGRVRAAEQPGEANEITNPIECALS